MILIEQQRFIEHLHLHFLQFIEISLNDLIAPTFFHAISDVLYFVTFVLRYTGFKFPMQISSSLTYSAQSNMRVNETPHLKMMQLISIQFQGGNFISAVENACVLFFLPTT